VTNKYTKLLISTLEADGHSTTVFLRRQSYTTTRQCQTIFLQLHNDRFSPNSATTRESWVKRRIQTEIYEKFPIRGHSEYLPISL